MSGPGSQSFYWRLMLTGNRSLILRRLFVLGLVVVSLTVWTLTILGAGLLAGDDSGGGKLRTAGASVIPPSGTMVRKTVVAADEATRDENSGAADEALEPFVPLQPPRRNPFAGDARYFPRPGPAGGVQDGLASGEPSARDEVPSGVLVSNTAPLRLVTTLLRGDRKVAIIQGNTFQLEGETVVLMFDHPEEEQGNRERSSQEGELRHRLKAGDTIEVYSARVGPNGVYLSRRARQLRIETITQRSVAFVVEDREYVLEMNR